MKRKYAVDEIEEMRGLIAERLGGASRVNPAEVEGQLRTYMQNGTSLNDLKDAWIDRPFQPAVEFRPVSTLLT